MTLQLIETKIFETSVFFHISIAFLLWDNDTFYL